MVVVVVYYCDVVVFIVSLSSVISTNASANVPVRVTCSGKNLKFAVNGTL